MNIIGTNSNETLSGSNADDSILGEGGADVIYAYNGNDFVVGGRGRDTIHGGGGDDNLYGDYDDDLIYGDSTYGDFGNDRVSGEWGNDTLVVGMGADTLLGGDGNDTFLIGGGVASAYLYDVYDGGTGYDSIEVRDVPSYVSTNQILIQTIASVERIVSYDSRPTIIFGKTLDLSSVYMENIFELQGEGGNDFLTGNKVFDTTANDFVGMTIRGGGGNDTLVGSSKGDFLFGDAGNDRLTGGAGSDRFVFGVNSGLDAITDFVKGSDKIELRQTSISDFSQLSITTDVNDLILAFDQTQVRLIGLAGTSLASGDFEFQA